MASQSSSLFSLARSKLSSSVSSKDNCSLHRWVLLKNSIIRSNPLTPAAASADSADANHVYPPDNAFEDDQDDDEENLEEEADSFMFPDAGKLVDSRAADVNASEAQWLDSLLETLGDDDEDFNVDSDVSVSVLPVDDDEDQLMSPLLSPASSSDDLPHPSSYYPPPIAFPYPVPYPPFHPPLTRSYEFDSTFDPPLTSMLPPYADPLPYYDLDVDDMSVPDAIEDTSDDESDAPMTPSLGRSSSSSTSSVDPTSIPLPPERTRRPPQPLVYIDHDSSYFYPFELDPVPSDDLNHSYNAYQEC